MFVVRINVEHNRHNENDVYCVGPFADRAAAATYCELYHGALDGTEILQVTGPATTRFTLTDHND